MSRPTPPPPGWMPAATPAARKRAGRLARVPPAPSRALDPTRGEERLTAARLSLPRRTGLRFCEAAPFHCFDRREDEDLLRALVHVCVDAAEVRVTDVADPGRAVGQLDEGLMRVGVREERLDVDRLAQRAVAGDELALVQRHQVGHEGRADRRAQEGQLLVDLGHVAVAGHAVGGHVLVGGDEVRGRGRRAPGARYPVLSMTSSSHGEAAPGGRAASGSSPGWRRGRPRSARGAARQLRPPRR
jgi:hypothetical protein